MSNQEVQSVSQQQRLMVGLSLLGLFLVVAIVAGLLAPGRDFLLVLRNILTSIAILAGLLCLLIYTARQMGWWLPPALRIPKGERDNDWLLLALSIVVIAFPIIMLLTQHLLFHQ